MYLIFEWESYRWVFKDLLNYLPPSETLGGKKYEVKLEQIKASDRPAFL